MNSKNCGIAHIIDIFGNNCTIAIALVDLFPSVYVTDYCI